MVDVFHVIPDDLQHVEAGRAGLRRDRYPVHRELPRDLYEAFRANQWGRFSELLKDLPLEEANTFFDLISGINPPILFSQEYSSENLQLLLGIFTPSQRLTLLLNQKNAEGNTLLTFAAAHRNKELVETILTLLPERMSFELLKQANNNGDTALILAAMNDDHEIVQTILNDVLTKDSTRNNIIDLLICKNNTGNTAFSWAAINGDHEMVLRFLKFSRWQFDLDRLIGDPDNKGYSAFMYAAWKGHHKTVEIILKHVPDYRRIAFLQQSDLYGNTAFMLAGCNDQYDTVSMILRYVPRDQRLRFFEQRNSDESTILMMVVASGNDEMVRIILNSLSPKDRNELLEQRDDYSHGPLFIAYSTNHPKTADILLSNYYNQVDQKAYWLLSTKKNLLEYQLASIYGRTTTLWGSANESGYAKFAVKWIGEYLSKSLEEPLSDPEKDILDKMKDIFQNHFYLTTQKGQIIEQVNLGQTIVLEGGWRGHVVSFVITSQDLLICNRGRGVEDIEGSSKVKSIVHYRLRPEQIPGLIDHIYEFESQPYSDDFYSSFCALLECEPVTEGLFKNFQQSKQRIGNCFFLSPKTALYGCILLEVRKKITASEEYLHELQQQFGDQEEDLLARQAAQILYKKFDRFMKRLAYEEYMSTKKELEWRYDPTYDTHLQEITGHHRAKESQVDQ